MWKILKDNVTGLTLKSLSSTRWESCVDSVKAIRSHILEIRESLLQVVESDNDAFISSEAKSLAENELGGFEFLVEIIIWYEILSIVNLTSKQLQSKDVLIDIAIAEVQRLVLFFKNYRETGFLEALKVAKEVSLQMDIDPQFRAKHKIKRKIPFDEGAHDASIDPQSGDESFRINYFILVVDHDITLLTSRFEQYQGFEKNELLFTYDKLRSLDNNNFMSACLNLENALKSEEHNDIHEEQLCGEIIFIRDLIKKSMGPLEILIFLKKLGFFSVVVIAYRILLIILVSVAFLEMSFSRLKLLKSYLRFTMTQEGLNGSATIVLENNVLKKLKNEDIIEDFVSRNSKRVMFFRKV